MEDGGSAQDPPSTPNGGEGAGPGGALTWQSTIILSPGSASPALGRGPGLADAVRLGLRAAQGGARQRGS